VTEDQREAQRQQWKAAERDRGRELRNRRGRRAGHRTTMVYRPGMGRLTAAPDGDGCPHPPR
jgi:hypothetical protein